jgi:hypothetical protein
VLIPQFFGELTREDAAVEHRSLGKMGDAFAVHNQASVHWHER